jgi:hypothetical protein
MNCDEYLELYSDFIDGILDEAATAECTEHQDACRSCGRYARVMREGVDLLRNLPTAKPASDFAPRLRHRLYHVEDNIPWAAAHPGGSAAVLAVAAVGLLSLFWLPFAAQIPVEVEFPPVAVDTPESPATPALFQSHAAHFFGVSQRPLPGRPGVQASLLVRPGAGALTASPDPLERPSLVPQRTIPAATPDSATPAP